VEPGVIVPLWLKNLSCYFFQPVISQEYLWDFRRGVIRGSHAHLALMFSEPLELSEPLCPGAFVALKSEALDISD
jgi:hypothetical protein